MFLLTSGQKIEFDNDQKKKKNLNILLKNFLIKNKKSINHAVFFSLQIIQL
jgi:hypothetical protein